MHDVIFVTSWLRQADATCVPAAPGQALFQCILVCVAAFLVQLSDMFSQWNKYVPLRKKIDTTSLVTTLPELVGVAGVLNMTILPVLFCVF